MLTPIQPEPGEVVVAEAGAGYATHILKPGQPGWPSDDQDLAALGISTARAVRIVALRNSLPLTRVSVRLRRDEDATVQISLVLEGPLEEWQRRYLRGIVGGMRVGGSA